LLVINYQAITPDDYLKECQARVEAGEIADKDFESVCDPNGEELSKRLSTNLEKNHNAERTLLMHLN